MTTKTEYLGNLRTTITHIESGTVLITDAPKDNQGEGNSFSPSDLLATSLSSCMLTIMGIAARTHGFSIDGAKATTSKIMNSSPRRVAEIVVDITFPHDNYSDKERKLLNAAARECPVAKSLSHEVKQTINFVFKK
ncbi:OsmC family protein [Porphyromonadaceae bacterium COT-184 OH4590]|nr:OsmC family protein [Porphyromonadaceae bacterium COT-184 OH4590]